MAICKVSLCLGFQYEQERRKSTQAGKFQTELKDLRDYIILLVEFVDQLIGTKAFKRL